MKIPNLISRLFSVLMTLVALLLAVFCGQWLWQHYEASPWTRDGRIKANIVQIAPDVSGQVTQIMIHDNQAVRQGQPLFQIDSARYAIALHQAETNLKMARIAYDQAASEARRNTALQELVAGESKEQGQSRLAQARATLEQAQIAIDLARLNLERTRVLAPVDGTIVNLDLRAGSYVSSGRPVMAEVEKDSFYVEAYFEETKLPLIHLNDQVRIRLMGGDSDLNGQVDSMAEGIVDRDRSTGVNMLPNINPTFNWVRLAQRIPVRIRLAAVPAGVHLVAGQTATVEVKNAANSSGPDRRRETAPPPQPTASGVRQ